MRPNDELNQRIMAERTDSLSQLSPCEQRIASGDGTVMRAIAENQAFNDLKPAVTAAPARRAMLDQVYRTADRQEEPKMTILSRLFSGKRWYVQAGIGAALLVAVCVLALIPTQPSWGQVNGYVLTYDMGAIPKDHLEHDLQGTILPKLQEVLKQFKEDYADELQLDGEELQLMMAIEAKEDNVLLSIGLTIDDPELQAALKEALKAIPELPEPSLTPSTWFFEGDKPCCDGGVKVQVNDRVFNFPPGTSEEEMEAQISAWLTEQNPDGDNEVNVDITDEDGRRKIKIEIKGCEEDCAEEGN